MSPSFIGRQAELKQLLELKEKNTASFVVVKGRRRIGKSRLIQEFGKHFEQYYSFIGLPPESILQYLTNLMNFLGKLLGNLIRLLLGMMTGAIYYGQLVSVYYQGKYYCYLMRFLGWAQKIQLFWAK